MENTIVGNFVANEIIKPGSEFLVSYKSNNTFGLLSNLKGYFKVARIIRNSKTNNYYFTVGEINGDKTIVVEPNQIHEIDGMTTERIISAFNLASDGAKKIRKRRKKSEILAQQQNK
jgi:tellurite resistance-related uncharacterized protein